MALYPAALRKLIPPGPTDPKIKARVVILHVAVSESASLYDYFNGPSKGVESHFYIRRDGTVEQYRDTAWQADANTDANGFAISIETQGLEAGEWTSHQIAAIKALILWCHGVHDIPLVRCTAWDGAGIGYHTLFPGKWDKRGASCPGPERKLQFNQIITPWLTSGATPAAPAKEWDDMASRDDLIDAFQEALLKFMISNPDKPEQQVSIATWIRLGLAPASRVRAIEAALVQLAASLPADVAAKVTDALDADYDAEITLTPKDA